MLRRFLCLISAVLICASCLVVPAAAADESVTLDTAAFVNAAVEISPFNFFYTTVIEDPSESPSVQSSYHSVTYNMLYTDFSRTVGSSNVFFTAPVKTSVPPHYQDDKSNGIYRTTELFNVTSQTFRVSTGVYLDPGFYDVKFGASFSRYLSSFGSYAYQTESAMVYSYFFVDSQGASCVPFYAGDQTHTYVELKNRSQLIVTISFGPASFPNNRSESIVAYPTVGLNMYAPSLTYRAVDPADIAALDAANNDASSSLDSYDEVESQWVSNMQTNFDALHVSDFSFGEGLLPAFVLISGIFQNIWSVMGANSIVYVFPLTLGIVLVVIGRLSKQSGRTSAKPPKDGDSSA